MLTAEKKQSIKNGLDNIISTLSSIHSTISMYKQSKELILSTLNAYTIFNNSQFPIDKLFALDSSVQDMIIYFGKPLDLNNTQKQYETFLLTEIATFSGNQHGFNNYVINQVVALIKRLQLPNYIIAPSDSDSINYMSNTPNNCLACINYVASLQCKCSILEKIKNIEGSIVMVGANGSGKSTLSRKLKGTLSSNVAILSAQHLLYYNKKDVLSTSGNEIEKVRSFQQYDKLSSDDNFQSLLTSDMDSLINALRSQNASYALESYDQNKPKEESLLHKTMSLWNEIIIHRKLTHRLEGLFVTGEGIEEYDFNLLSDGEKAVFYYIGHILMAKSNSYIIIDEPNNFLHPTICIKLWDTLELKRPDCKFIYLTHDLTFASSRNNCTILWNKCFVPPMTWDFEILPHNEIIPDVLIMELLGCRNKVCFCEGKKGGLDYKVYSALFPDCTLIPVEGHRNVIAYTNAYNSAPIFHSSATGIIDGDHHLSAQIEKWKSQGIHVLPLNEIENMLCDEYMLKKASEAFCSDESAISKYYDRFWNMLEESKEEQATNYVNEYINHHLTDALLHENKNISNLKAELSELYNTSVIEEKYSSILNKINSIIKNRNYPEALKIVNFKKRLTSDLSRTIVDKYEERIVELIKKDSKIKEYLLNAYFKGFNA